MNSLIVSLHADGKIDGTNLKSIYNLLNMKNVLSDPSYHERYGEQRKAKPRREIIKRLG